MSLVSYFISPPVCTDSRDDAEGPLLAEEEGQSDLASFQATESDVPSFLADGNRVCGFFSFSPLHSDVLSLRAFSDYIYPAQRKKNLFFFPL